MKNFFKRKSKKKKEESFYIELPLGIFAKQVAFDTHFDDVQVISNLIGSPPMSEDVADMEREASIQRLEDIFPLASLVNFHAQIIGGLSAKYHRLITGDELDEDELEQLEGVYTGVAFAATSSILSVMHYYGLISILGINPRLVDEEDDE